MDYKRYEDADLMVVDNEIALAGIPLNPRPLWQWILMGVIVVAAFNGVGWVVRNRAGEAEIETSLYELPEPVTPFAVIGLLRDMRSDRRLKWNIDQQHELDRTISQLESYYLVNPATAITIRISIRLVNAGGDRLRKRGEPEARKGGTPAAPCIPRFFFLSHGFTRMKHGSQYR